MAEKTCKRDRVVCPIEVLKLVVLALHWSCWESSSFPQDKSYAHRHWGSKGRDLCGLFAPVKYAQVIHQGTESVPEGGLGSDTGDQLMDGIYIQVSMDIKRGSHWSGLARRGPCKGKPRPILFSPWSTWLKHSDPRLAVLKFWMIFVPAVLRVEKDYSVWLYTILLRFLSLLTP